MPPELIETHSAVLVFVGDRVYKFKKPVDLGFLDFSTLEARRVACEREVQLNRRLAPDVYEGVATVVAPDGTTCEHLVVMRRMPADRRLSACLGRGEDVTDDVREVARAIAGLHEASPPAGERGRLGSVSAIRRLWDDGFGQIAASPGSVLDRSKVTRLEQLVHRYLDGRTALFDHRVAAGWIRDGHGDLQADDIFLLGDGPRILDCLDFSDDLRWGDALGDVAFLAMDLERLGHAELANEFLDWHREFTADNWPASLAHHYVAQRAFVRAKVLDIRCAQGDATVRDDANAFLDLAVRHAEAGRVRLVLIGGLPGTGKSTVAAGLSDARAVTVLRTDELRPPPPAAAGATETGYGEGRYNPASVAANYESLLRRAQDVLQLGESVVLDASWSADAMRASARAVAAATSSDVVEIVCQAPSAVAAQRMAIRSSSGDDPSEATPSVAAAMAAGFDPWPEATVLDTDRPIDACVGAALAVLDEAIPSAGS